MQRGLHEQGRAWALEAPGDEFTGKEELQPHPSNPGPGESIQCWESAKKMKAEPGAGSEGTMGAPGELCRLRDGAGLSRPRRQPQQEQAEETGGRALRELCS